MNTAEKIAADFGNDGAQFFGGPDELHLELVCRQAGAYVSKNHERDTVALNFRDGSAIVIAGGSSWDIRHPACECGHCWAGVNTNCREMVEKTISDVFGWELNQ